MAIKYSSLFVESPQHSGVYEDRSPRPNKVGEIVQFNGTLTISAAATAGDKWRFVKVPKGARLKDWNAEWGDLDTDGTPTLVHDFGWETTDPDAFLNDSTLFQAADSTAAGNSYTENATELLFDAVATTAEDYLSATIVTGAAALSAAATITFRGSFYVPAIT
jgi:hypothetical protein